MAACLQIEFYSSQTMPRNFIGYVAEISRDFMSSYWIGLMHVNVRIKYNYTCSAQGGIREHRLFSARNQISLKSQKLNVACVNYNYRPSEITILPFLAILAVL